MNKIEHNISISSMVQFRWTDVKRLYEWRKKKTPNTCTFDYNVHMDAMIFDKMLDICVFLSIKLIFVHAHALQITIYLCVFFSFHLKRKCYFIYYLLQITWNTFIFSSFFCCLIPPWKIIYSLRIAFHFWFFILCAYSLYIWFPC